MYRFGAQIQRPELGGLTTLETLRFGRTGRYQMDSMATWSTLIHLLRFPKVWPAGLIASDLNDHAIDTNALLRFVKVRETLSTRLRRLA